MLCIALLALLVFALGFAVSITRGRTKTGIGHPDDPNNFVHKMVRCHGNAVEYAPALMLLIYILSQTDSPGWVMWLMVLVTVARYLQVVGMVFSGTLAKANPFRFMGSLGTYVGGMGLTIALLMHV